MPRKTSTTYKKHYLIQNSIFWSMYLGTFSIFTPVVNRMAISILCRRAVSGDGDAAKRIAIAFAKKPSESVYQLITQSIQKIQYPEGVNSFWEIGFNTREPLLLSLLVNKGMPANAPLIVAAFSHILLNNISPLQSFGPSMIHELVVLQTDKDEKIADTAIDILSNLSRSKLIDQFCKIWAETRSTKLEFILLKSGYLAESPPEIYVLTALKQNRIDRVIRGSADVVSPLILACNDKDNQIANNALSSLRGLKNNAAINELCKTWAENREMILEEAITHARFIASSPPKIRILTALLNKKSDFARNISPEDVHYLVGYTQDPHSEVRKEAISASTSLSNPDTIEKLCALYLFDDHQTAFPLIQAAGYLPQKIEDQALFYFLSENWLQYNVVDFDQRLMRNQYEIANENLRLRIRQILQSAGQTAYLSILAGVDYKSKNKIIASEEAQLLLRVLSDNQEWTRLWSYVTEFALAESLQIIKTLDQNYWHPLDQNEIELFKSLQKLSKSGCELNAEKIAGQLPTAVLQQTVKVRGRVNDLEFSPTDPHLSIGTGQKQVVVWNYQTGNVHKTIRNFSHSIGNITYTQDGVLVIGERSSNNTHCGLFSWTNEQITLINSYHSSINTLESVSQSHVLCTTRDGKISFWDLSNRRKISENTLDFWARAVCVSEEHMEAALFDQDLHIVSLKTMKTLSPKSSKQMGKKINKSVARKALFTPDGDTILVGQNNGEIVSYTGINSRAIKKKKLPVTHSASISGLEWIPERNQLITSSVDGVIQLFRWPELTLIGRLESAVGDITSLHISKNAGLMATGSKTNRIDLFDLRVPDIGLVITQPISKINPEYLEVLRSLLATNSLPSTIQNTLEYLQVVLQYRFRFDIQIGEVSKLKTGEFDIIIEE